MKNNIDPSTGSEIRGRWSAKDLRKTSRAAGILYLITFVSVPTLFLYRSIWDNNYLNVPGEEDAVIMGGILELIVGFTGIATAIVLYPVLKRQHEGLALGLVASRVLEASTIFMGVASCLTVVTLHQQEEGVADTATIHSFSVMYGRLFQVGQHLLPAVDDLLLGYLLYRSRLVPRLLSMIGMLGAFPLLAGHVALVFGLIGQHSAWAGLSALGVALFEFSLGLYMLIKGFKPVVERRVDPDKPGLTSE